MWSQVESAEQVITQGRYMGPAAGLMGEGVTEVSVPGFSFSLPSKSMAGEDPMPGRNCALQGHAGSPDTRIHCWSLESALWQLRAL